MLYRSLQSSLRVPWLSLAKSLPFYALAVAHFTFNWGYFTLLTTLPQYFKHVLHFDIQSVSDQRTNTACLNCPHNWNETETKLKQNSFKTVSKKFCFSQNKTPDRERFSRFSQSLSEYAAWAPNQRRGQGDDICVTS